MDLAALVVAAIAVVLVAKWRADVTKELRAIHADLDRIAGRGNGDAPGT